jgi:hypothetical protein
MAEAKPADPLRVAEGNQRVVPLGAAKPQANRGETESGVSQRAFAIVLALLVFASAALIVQTQRVSNKAARIAALEGQVEGLSVQLSAANTQIATYDMQMLLIRSTVASITDQMANLSDLVGTAPVPLEPAMPPTPPESPAGR